LQDVYIPRGCLPVREALDLLIEERHPGLVSRLDACGQQIGDLKRLRARARRRSSEGLVGNGFPEQAQPTFTEAHEQRLRKSIAAQNQILSLLDDVADELRVALAEGDLPAKLLTSDGHEHVIDKSRWRASDGLDCVRADRIELSRTADPLDFFNLLLPSGVALVNERQFKEWMRLPCGEVKIDEHSRTQPQHKPRRPSPAGLRRWYERRVQQWPGGCKHPSAEQDWQDAKAEFHEHEVSRDAIRALRNELAPPAWTAHGRRKSARE